MFLIRQPGPATTCATSGFTPGRPDGPAQLGWCGRGHDVDPLELLVLQMPVSPWPVAGRPSDWSGCRRRGRGRRESPSSPQSGISTRSPRAVTCGCASRPPVIAPARCPAARASAAPSMTASAPHAIAPGRRPRRTRRHRRHDVDIPPARLVEIVPPRPATSATAEAIGARMPSEGRAPPRRRTRRALPQGPGPHDGARPCSSLHRRR